MNKGFQALPEYVQRKIDPEMAKKYYGGGSVMQRPLFRQMGGPAEADMAQMAAMGQQFLMPEAQPPMAPQQVDPQQAAMVQAQEQHNMEDGQKVGEMYASEMMNQIEMAEDPKSMIDAFRGNEKPLEARYAELAGYVGEADANKTPESVLAMVQPTIMMTEEGAVDSGIGELMQGLVQSVEMEPESQMAQGVGELMAMGAGNTPPVNFNQGGAVRHYAPGGAVTERATTMLPEFQNLYASVLGDPAQRQAELDEQKRLTQAQMLFDIAQAGLQFAGTTQGNTIAERLANAAAASQVFPRIGERAAGQLQAKQTLEAEKRQMDLAALQSALGAATTEYETEAALKKAEISNQPKDKYSIRELKTGNEVKIIATNERTGNSIVTGTFPAADDDTFSSQVVETNEGIKVIVTNTRTGEQNIQNTFAAPSTDTFKTDFVTTDQGIEIISTNTKTGEVTKKDVLGAPSDDKFTMQKVETKDGVKLVALNTTTGQRTILDTFAAPDDATFTTQQITDADGIKLITTNNKTGETKIAQTFAAPDDATYSLTKVETDQGIKVLITNNKTGETLEKATYKSPTENIKGVPPEIYNALSDEEQKALLGVVPVTSDKFITKTIETAEGTVLKIINERTGEELREETFDPVKTGSPIKFTYPDKDGKLVSTIALLNTPEGQELQKKVNDANAKTQGSANMEKLGTENLNPQAYLLANGEVVTSFDNRTYVAKDGTVKSLQDPNNTGQALGDADVYSIIKKQSIINYGKERLNEATKYLDTKIYVGADNKPLPAEQQQALRKLEKETIQNLFGDITEEDVRKGTGFFSNLFALANNIGGTVAPEFFSKTFASTEEARLALERFNLIAVSALTVNPRLAVYDIQRVERILPKATNLLKNPATEAKKFKELVTTMKAQRSRLLQAIADEDPVALENIGQTMAKIRELDGVLAMVRITDSASSKSLSEALGQTEDEFE